MEVEGCNSIAPLTTQFNPYQRITVTQTLSMPKGLAQFSPPVREAAATLWHYHRLGCTPGPADGILVFGSNDLRVADYAVALYKMGLAPWLLVSGARGRMTRDWPQTEAATMAALARSRGVPNERLYIEHRATHTGDNIRFSRELLAVNDLTPQRIIVVQKPYMERRTLAALDIQWSTVKAIVTSPPFTLESYCTDGLSPRMVVEAMVGDFQRILDYPALGFASKQPVPPDVLDAYRILRDAGFDAQLRR